MWVDSQTDALTRYYVLVNGLHPLSEGKTK
jgi:hypothetical protein